MEGIGYSRIMKSADKSIDGNSGNTATKIRCFLGFKVDARDSLSSLREELNSLANKAESKLRPTTDQNLHLTLQFFGSVNQERLGSIQSIAEQIASRHPAIRLHMQGIGFFRNAIWIGVKPDPALLVMAEECKLAFSAIGLGSIDSQYLPHITVARFDSNAKLPLSQLTDKYGHQQWGFFCAEEISLFRSDTLPGGARYSVIFTAALAKP